MSYKIKIPIKIKKNWSLNKIYAGVHWAKRKQDKDYMRLLVRACLKEKRKFEGPVRLTFEFLSKLDVSNHAYLVKLIEDSLVHNGILKDDTREYVGEIVMRHQDDYEGVVLGIEEMG
jgi:Holliday junction resolvase RusA-like endonuclease